MRKRFKTVAVGGTFDKFHKGHRALLEKAFEVGERVLIGLCSDGLVEKLNKPHQTASYRQRLADLETFLSEHSFLERSEIVVLNDVYGVTLSEGCIQALIVSKETEPTASRINEKRERLGLPPLHVITIEMISSEDHSPISTTRIHRREIDAEGRLLEKPRKLVREKKRS